MRLMMDSYAIILSIIFLMCAVIGLAYLSYDSHVQSKKKVRITNNDRPRNTAKRS